MNDANLAAARARASDTEAQSNSTLQAMTTAPPGPPAPSSWWTNESAMTMCSVVLMFGVVVLGLAAWLMKEGRSSTSILRIFGTILIVVMTTFLVVAGYNNEQLAAPLGLLGTIAGYLLGKETTAAQEQRGTKEAPGTAKQDGESDADAGDPAQDPADPPDPEDPTGATNSTGPLTNRAAARPSPAGADADADGGNPARQGAGAGAA